MLTRSTETTRHGIETWLEGQRRKLIRSAYAILRDHDEAEDVVQQTLLAVWQRAQRQEIRNLGGYLARAVRWNALKRRARQRIDISLESLPSSSAAVVTVPDDRLDPFELELAIAQLPATQQTVLRLRFYLGLSFKEIGTNLAISTNTAASRTRYALANLRRAIGLPHRTENKEARDE